MASSQRNSPKSQESEEVDYAITAAKIDKLELHLRQEFLRRRELHNSFDLNQTTNLPVPANSEKSRSFQNEYQNGVQKKFKVVKRSDNKKKRVKNMEIRSAQDEVIIANYGTKNMEIRSAQNESNIVNYGTKNTEIQSAQDEGTIANDGMDLELRLSSLSSSSVQNRSNSSIPSSELSYEHEVSDLAVSKAAEVPLVLMGCTNCYLYVMVPKNDPKCPKCESFILIDKFQGNNSAKRSRSS